MEHDGISIDRDKNSCKAERPNFRAASPPNSCGFVFNIHTFVKAESNLEGCPAPDTPKPGHTVYRVVTEEVQLTYQINNYLKKKCFLIQKLDIRRPTFFSRLEVRFKF